MPVWFLTPWALFISFTLIWNLNFLHLNCLCSDQWGFCPRNSSSLCSFVFKGSLASFERLRCPEFFVLACGHYLVLYAHPLWGWQKPQLSVLYTESLMAILVFLFSALSDVLFFFFFFPQKKQMLVASHRSSWCWFYSCCIPACIPLTNPF